MIADNPYQEVRVDCKVVGRNNGSIYTPARTFPTPTLLQLPTAHLSLPTPPPLQYPKQTMFSRAVRPAVAVARNAQQQQGMATLREIEQRLKSVKNIEKITKVGTRVLLVIGHWRGVGRDAGV